MRTPTWRGLALLVLTTAIVLAAAASASAATFVVTSRDDVGDGLCDASHCSLRDAIQAANATTGADGILSNVSQPITPITPLPPITETTHVNSSATGSCLSEAPLRLDGAPADFPGLVFLPGADGSRLCRVFVTGFTNGIEFRSDGNAIRQSVIGASPNGTIADPNSEAGILVTGDDNRIGGRRDLDRNLISGNALDGVFVEGPADGTRIQGNRIGTDQLGATALGNLIGVHVAEEASNTTVGGTEALTGNVISGNGVLGVNSGDGRVVGNLIGLNETGTGAIPNRQAGVNAFGPVEIGGSEPAERNVISGNAVADVELRGAATVQGNRIGLRADGTELPGDTETGVLVLAGADGATIGGAQAGEGNVIAGHDVDVKSLGAAGGFAVQGNVIGQAANGTTNVSDGIGIEIGAGTTGAQLGGAEDGAGNTVATDVGTGIAVAGDEARIEGNTVGLDTGGESSNQEVGITVEDGADGTSIGGDDRGAGNLISGNLAGIELRGGSRGTIVEGNLIGTDRSGNEARPNDIGISIGEEDGPDGARVEARIGGARPAQRNVISGNVDLGVMDFCTDADVVIEGNHIGVGADGSTALGNGIGLSLGCDSFIAPAPAPGDGFVVGGTAAGAGNRIAHNDGDDFDFTDDGVQVGHTAGGVMILGNEIFANGHLGIDLFEDGVSPNGSQGSDIQPPFPVLTGADAVSAGTSVQGTIDFPAGRDVRIEFFSAPSCDGSGHGEGQTPLGALAITGSGAPAAFSARIATAPAGHVITATATDLELHRTSEFSRCALLTAGPPPPDPPPDDPPPGPGPSDSLPQGPIGSGPGPVLGIPVTDVDPRPRCKVPNVLGLTVAKARRRLTIAGCGVGKVTRPKRRPGKRFRLVVKRTSVSHGASRPPGTAIELTLKWKRVKRG